jgi:hypothetical protein
VVENEVKQEIKKDEKIKVNVEIRMISINIPTLAVRLA